MFAREHHGNVSLVPPDAAPTPAPAPVATRDDLLVARYGVRRAGELLGRPARSSGGLVRRRRAVALVGATAAVAAAVTWVGWASRGHDPGAVGSQLIGLSAPGPHAISAVFRVVRPPGTPLRCVLTATDAAGNVVGRAVVPVPASTTTAAEVRARVAAVSTPVSVTVDGCQQPGGSGLH